MKLLNHFTTQEQSKRLLELGVPANSADCYFTESGKIEIKNTALDILYTPCWSVGRLIEIYLNSVICPRYFDHTKFVFPLPQDKETIMDYIIDRIETAVNLEELRFSELYFSPLE